MIAEELDQQAAHLFRLLLLHPMSGAVQQLEADHSRARRGAHAIDHAGRLVGAPITLPPDEHRRHVDAAARERAHLGLALGVGAAPHPIALQRAGELRAAIFEVGICAISAAVRAFNGCGLFPFQSALL
jgi:hypothetical protein